MFVYAETVEVGDIVLDDLGIAGEVLWTAPVDDSGLMQIQTTTDNIVLDDNDVIVKVQQ